MDKNTKIIGLGKPIKKSNQNFTQKSDENNILPNTIPNREFDSKSLISTDDSKFNKITLYVLTRDFRTSDNLTLYSAYDDSLNSKTNLCVIFKFNSCQISNNENQYLSSNGLQFMVESLQQFSKEINISFIDPISDQEFLEILKTLSINKIYITRDFTPFARKRFENLSSVATTIEIDDITVYPINSYETLNTLAGFLKLCRSMKFPTLQNREVDWKKNTHFLNNFLPIKSEKIHDGFFKIDYIHNDKLLVRPSNLKDCIENLSENLIGYSNKVVRQLVGKPKVSHISAFLKFGLISIRAAHLLADKVKGPSKDDKDYFHRELYFRDFFYRIAFDKYFETFHKSNYEGNQPRFICEKDLFDWKSYKGMNPSINKEELIDIEISKKIYEEWTRGETKYPLVNAAIKEMTTTGYMLNRTRMITVSYLIMDRGLWWKYAEKFFANHLTDYDWVINLINHQNLANVGFYPSRHFGFNIKKQQEMEPQDKMIYYNKYL